MSSTEHDARLALEGFAERIASVFPAEVSIQCMHTHECDEELFPAEKAYIRNAVAKRRREFVTGRACARLALSRLGRAPCSIPPGPQRQPIWPDGIAGSLSHDGDLCIAVVAEKRDFTHLGIDVTLSTPLPADVISMVCTGEDLRGIADLGIAAFPADPHKIVFSLKESAYKCLFPIVNRVFDFHDVSLEMDPATGTASLKLVNRSLFASPLPELVSAFFVLDKYIFSAVFIPGQKITALQSKA